MYKIKRRKKEGYQDEGKNESGTTFENVDEGDI